MIKWAIYFNGLLLSWAIAVERSSIDAVDNIRDACRCDIIKFTVMVEETVEPRRFVPDAGQPRVAHY